MTNALGLLQVPKSCFKELGTAVTRPSAYRIWPTTSNSAGDPYIALVRQYEHHSPDPAIRQTHLS